MKKKSHFKKLAAKYVNYTHQKGKANEAEILKILGDLKTLPRSQAIYIISKFLKGARKRKGETTLLIESAIPLSKNEQQNIVKKLQKEHVITEVKQVIKPDILGGFKVTIGDTVLDYSLAGKISQLKGAVIS